jgi:hypothetical protein
MFIELTDLLRCPNPHDEAYLVLLPERMDGRRVIAGHLGCPLCGWSVDWEGGVPDFGGGARSTTTPPFDASAAVAMLGLHGPGGWLALGGSAGALAHDIARLLPGVQLVAVNPPDPIEGDQAVSVLLGEAWPIKTHAVRGAVLGADAASWRDPALASVLPGLRMVGSGAPPDPSTAEVLGESPGLWVVRHR